MNLRGAFYTPYSLSRGAPSASWVLLQTVFTYGRCCGGESGIRTHGRFHVAGFQDRFLQPLGHLSILECPSPEHLWYITISPPPLSTGKRKFAPGNFLEIFQSFFQKRLAFWKKTCYYNQADFESSKQMNPGVAQLVAHLTGGQGVVSSSLATRTK